ncbi:hypothetical protein ACN4EG_12325 [Alkalinema pantanalense CENA528]|uniref:hypothetical protein n=1 Tax=Alkalinema pantanalense TaxID=1620705 RepID=UPI003D6E3D98
MKPSINLNLMQSISQLSRHCWKTVLMGLATIPVALSSLPSAQALTVSPSGVNINTFGATTVFLTYISLNDYSPVEAIWCGDINADQSCVPGTVYGRLPKRSDRGRLSGSNNYTDIMTIPPSIARKAYQDAVKGSSSEFFYVRRFVSRSGLPDQFIAVTCRLAGGGARVPLALTNVRLRFETARPEQPIPVIDRNQPLPPFHAELTYNGTGRLKGRWEVVLPGDIPPTQDDLLTEATLPIEQRALQQRYSVIDRFETYLMPTGRAVIPGPDPRKIPRGTDGLHLILFRVEATDDKEGDSETGIGTVKTGGVAGFSLPVLRYYVGNPPNSSQSKQELRLLQPLANASLPISQGLQFRWGPIANAKFYRLAIHQGEQLVLSALLDANTTSYSAPPLLKEQVGKTLQWQVTAIGSDGKTLLQSPQQVFTIQP